MVEILDMLTTILCAVLSSVAYGPTPEIPAHDFHCEIKNQRLEILSVENKPIKSMYWSSVPDEINKLHIATSTQISIRNDGDIYLYSCWRIPDTILWYNITIIQGKDGHIDLQFTINKLGKEYEFKSFEAMLIAMPEMRQMLNQRLFAFLNQSDPINYLMAKKLSDNKKLPKEFTDKIESLISELDNKDSKIRRNATNSLISMGEDCAIYLMREVYKRKLTIEQRLRIDTVIYTYIN